MGERARSVEARGPTWRRAGGGTTPPHGVGTPVPSSDSPLVFVNVLGENRSVGFCFVPF